MLPNSKPLILGARSNLEYLSAISSLKESESLIFTGLKILREYYIEMEDEIKFRPPFLLLEV